MERTWRITATKACVFFVAVFSLALLSLIGSAKEEPSLEMHYEMPNDSHVSTYDPPALYRLAFGEEPSGEVLEYLTYMSGVRFFVSDSVTANVRAFYSEGVLTVEGDAYSYTAENGASVVFLPDSLDFGGEKLSFESTDRVHYVSRIACSEADAERECTVTYKAAFTLSDPVLEDLLNGAFNRGSEFLEKKKAYEREKASYESALLEYRAYQDALARYPEDKKRYDDYCAALTLYKSALRTYESYLEKKASYDAALEKHEKYLEDLAAYHQKREEYDAYIAACDRYPQALKEYRELSAQRAYEIAKLAVIDSSFFYTEDLDSMHVTLKGETVALVVSQKEGILEQAGNYDGLTEAIDAADISSKKLQTLLDEYLALYRAASDEDKYAYYAAHYQEFLDNYCLLYSSLDHLFDNGIVQTVLKKNDRYTRYKEFLAQLFILSTCLDDSQTLDTKVVIADGDRVCDLITDDRVLVDTDHAKPSLSVLPAQAEPPIYPEKVSLPTKPKEVAHPGEPPKEIAEPKEPEKVDAPTLPPSVDEPTPPAVLQMTASEKRLCEAVESGTLKARAHESTATLSIESSVSVAVSVPNRVTVSYYDSDRKSLIYVARVEEGNPVSYGGKTPVKESDPYAHYEFAGFVDDNGRKFEDGTVFLSDTCLYATYKETPITYTVSFLLDGTEYTSTYVYGEIPRAPQNTDKASDARYRYVFEGWSPAVSYVTGDAQYTALYSQIERFYKITFVSKGESVMRLELPYGAMPAFQGELPKGEVTDRYVESFVRWTPAIASVERDTVYTAVFRKDTFGYDANGDPLAAVTDENGVLTIANATGGFNNGHAFEYAASKNTDLLLSFPGGDVLITHENARILADGGALSVSLTGSGSKRALRVAFENGQTISDVLFEVTLDVSGYLREDAVFRIRDGATKKSLFFTLNEGKAHLSLKPNTEILLSNEFDIGVIVGGNTGGSDNDSDGEKPTEDKGSQGDGDLPSNEEATMREPVTEGTGQQGNEEGELPTQEKDATHESGADDGESGDQVDGDHHGGNANAPDADYEFIGGSINLDCESAVEGDPITITAHPLYGYYLKSLSVVIRTADGGETKIPLQGMIFIMPNAPVTVKAEFAKKTYLLRYLDEDGTVLLEQTLTFFDEEPTVKAPTGTETRVFDCWDKQGSAEEGTLVYRARYRDIVYADPETSYERDYGGWRFRDYLPHAAIVAGSLCVLIVFLRIFRKTRKKSK